jgi:hypothetical protein
MVRSMFDIRWFRLLIAVAALLAPAWIATTVVSGEPRAVLADPPCTRTDDSPGTLTAVAC